MTDDLPASIQVEDLIIYSVHICCRLQFKMKIGPGGIAGNRIGERESRPTTECVFNLASRISSWQTSHRGYMLVATITRPLTHGR